MAAVVSTPSPAPIGPRITAKDVENRFQYHPPKTDQAARYATLRSRFENVAKSVLEFCPQSRELSLSLTHLEQAMFYANAAIARNE